LSASRMSYASDPQPQIEHPLAGKGADAQACNFNQGHSQSSLRAITFGFNNDAARSASAHTQK